MQGVEVADAILFGAPELTLFEPDWVNGRRCASLHRRTRLTRGRNTERRL